MYVYNVVKYSKWNAVRLFYGLPTLEKGEMICVYVYFIVLFYVYIFVIFNFVLIYVFTFLSKKVYPLIASFMFLSFLMLSLSS